MAAVIANRPWERGTRGGVRDGSTFVRLLADHSGTFHAWLGTGFAGIGEDGLALAFACVVAARLKPWGAAAPTGWDLASLLRAPSLTCDQYVALALRLFGAARTSPSSRLRIAGLGWRASSAIGNHALLVAWDGDLALLLDPTVGVVAATDVARRLSSTRLGPAPVAALDAEPITARLRDCVLAVLSGDATLSPRDLIYAFAPSADRVSPRHEDFIARAAHDGARPLWLTVSGDLRQPDATDLPRSPLVWATLAASREAGHHGLDVGGTLWSVRGRSRAVVGTGVDALVAGSGGLALWTLANGQVAAWPTAPAPGGGGCVALAAGIGDCSAICLERDGTAWGLRVGRPRRRLAGGVTDLQQGLGAEQDRAAYLLCGNGDLLRAVRGRFGRLAIRRVWDATACGARARIVRLGLAGGWVALLLDEGTVAHGMIEPGSGGGAAWTRWRDGPFVALDLADRGWTLAARRADGSVRQAAASPSF
jgi:hypothetical protein